MAVRSASSTSDPAVAGKPAKARPALLRIRVHYDVGHGNRITIRGDTAPYCWDQGLDAQNTADDIWEFSLERIPAGKRFEFKPLINDMTYSSGDNFIGTGRQTLDIYPVF
jgi:hypothetical protein